ncbi:MAG: nucleoside deaminase [Prolixibacteraceae bacterium]|nr:nucleoside deaminase [Prolixibacteraceae bacterium]
MNKNELMTRALQLAAENVARKGGPFGAIIVKDGKIVGEGVNQVPVINDPTAHAEVQAIRDACKNLNTFRLEGCEIYTSCEPCPMCFSSIYWAHIDKVYYAANHEDADRAGFDDGFIYKELRVEMHERKIPFEALQHDLKLLPFEKWNDLDDKIQY